MPLAAWVTLLAVFLIVGITAVALLRVIFHLKHVSFTLGTVIMAVRAIAHQSRTVPEVLPRVNQNLAPVRSLAESVER